MKQRVLGTAVATCVAALALVVGWASPAGAQDLQPPSTPIFGTAGQCEGYLSSSGIFGFCNDTAGFIGPIGQPLTSGNPFGDIFFGDDGPASSTSNGDGGGGGFFDFFNNFNLVSSEGEGAAGLAPVGAVLGGMALVYGTMLRILRRRLAHS